MEEEVKTMTLEEFMRDEECFVGFGKYYPLPSGLTMVERPVVLIEDINKFGEDDGILRIDLGPDTVS